MPKEQSLGKPTTRRYSAEEKAGAVRMVRSLRAELGPAVSADNAHCTDMFRRGGPPGLRTQASGPIVIADGIGLRRLRRNADASADPIKGDVDDRVDLP